MRPHHVFEVHPVKLVAREDQHVIDPALFDIADIFADRVGGSLVPIGTLVNRLLGGQQFDEATIKVVESVSLAEVAVQRNRQKLRQNVNAIHAAVDTVADRNVDQSVFAGQRDRRFCTDFCEWKESSPSAATKNEGDGVAHVHLKTGCSMVEKWLPEPSPRHLIHDLTKTYADGSRGRSSNVLRIGESTEDVDKRTPRTRKQT